MVVLPGAASPWIKIDRIWGRHKMGNFGFKNVSKRSNIDLMEYLCYGLGDFSFCFIYGAIGSYFVFFYTDVACISAATVGTVLLVSKIFDGNSEMLKGNI